MYSTCLFLGSQKHNKNQEYPWRSKVVVYFVLESLCQLQCLVLKTSHYTCLAITVTIFLWINDYMIRNQNCGYLQVYFIHKLQFALWQILCSLGIFWNLVGESFTIYSYLQYCFVSLWTSFYSWHHV